MKQKFFWVAAAALFVSGTLHAQTTQSELEKLDLEMAFRIKQEAATNSQIENYVYAITDAVGPRLTGSDRMEVGYQVALDELNGIGLSNIEKEFARDWHRGGWDLTRAYCAMTAPYYMPIYPFPMGWSGGTNGEKEAEVMILNARTADELNTYKGKVKGKIILIGSKFRYKISDFQHPNRRPDEELEALVTDYPMHEMGAPRKDRTPPPFGYAQIVEFLDKEGAIAVLNLSGAFNVPRTTHHDHNQNSKEPIAQLNITAEAHGLMQRLIEKGEQVTMEVDVAAKFTKDRPIYNILAEIPGTDPALKDELIIIGAHLDSHQGGTGATDNAAGVVSMMEAMRILKTLGVEPRRTIRIALWGGEEMGLHGSNGYLEQHVYDPATGEKKAEYDKISVYFNSDYGPGRFRGVYAQDNLMANPIFKAWIEPYRDMGLTTVTNRSVGSSDHMPFDDAGVPGFQFIHDTMEWDLAAHQAMDYSDRLNINDLKHNAAVIAWFVYNAAMRDDMMPRKPMK